MGMFAKVAMAMAALGHAVKVPVMPMKRYTSSRKSRDVKNGGRKAVTKGQRHHSLRSRSNRRKARRRAAR